MIFLNRLYARSASPLSTGIVMTPRRATTTSPPRAAVVVVVDDPLEDVVVPHDAALAPGLFPGFVVRHTICVNDPIAPRSRFVTHEFEAEP